MPKSKALKIELGEKIWSFILNLYGALLPLNGGRLVSETEWF